jgi:hypothetical protein
MRFADFAKCERKHLRTWKTDLQFQARELPNSADSGIGKVSTRSYAGETLTSLWHADCLYACFRWVDEGTTSMEEETKRLLDELKGAINQSLLSSNRFAHVLDLLERAGHEVSVSVDATIDKGDGPDWIEGQPVGKHMPVELNLTTKDRNFLHKMKIDAGGRTIDPWKSL